MSYFDHVRCTECNASFDPERVDSSSGVMACPHCKAGLKLKNLFGLGAAFAEEETPDLGLDDLIPEGDRDITWFGQTATGQPVDREEYLRRERAGQAKAAPKRPPASSSGAGRALPARKAGREYTDGGGGSALDVLRSLKKK